jgi:hypothetical protein
LTATATSLAGTGAGVGLIRLVAALGASGEGWRGSIIQR